VRVSLNTVLLRIQDSSAVLHSIDFRQAYGVHLSSPPIGSHITDLVVSVRSVRRNRQVSVVLLMLTVFRIEGQDTFSQIFVIVLVLPIVWLTQL
jgi:hypothetical protein